MKYASGAILTVLIAASICSSGDVRLPTPTIPEIPTPEPTGVYLLAGDDVYPVESDSPLTIRTAPRGIIEFETRKPGTYFWKTGGKWVEKELKGPHVYFGKAVNKGRVECEFFWAKDGTITSKTALVDCLTAPQPPPKPDDPVIPEPKDDDPPIPVPVTSFRVIFVVESMDTITKEEHSIIYGKAVEDFLTAKCTEGKNGWRRRDKDAEGDNDLTMTALWRASRPEFHPPKNTKTPAVIVAVNENAEVIPLEATPEAMIAKFKSYLGEK